MKDVYRLRRGLYGGFLLIGFVMASWIVRTPSIRDALDASTAQMGWILFGLSFGSMSGILMASRWVSKFRADKSMIAGQMATMLGILLIAAGTYVSSPWGTAIGFAILGLGMAVAEVAVNILASYVERRLSTSVLTLVHGCFSLGTAIGAICGLLIVSMGVSVQQHMLLACGFLLPLLVYVSRSVLNTAGNEEVGTSGSQGFFQTLRKDPKLLLIGLIVVSVALAEGAANDWLPLLIVDSHGVPEQFGSMVFVAFAITMTIGRFVGKLIVDHYGPILVMRVSGTLGALGILTVILSQNVYIAGFAVVLWGIGAALGFPVAMSAGAANGDNPGARISVLAVIGYTAFLVGPPFLGFLGNELGLRLAMVAVLVMQIFPIAFAWSLGAGPASQTFRAQVSNRDGD